MPTDTILSRLAQNARTMPDDPAYFTKAEGAWQPTTWREYEEQVRRAARALIALGVEPDQVITIVGFNRPEWVISDLACMAVGGAPAGIYTTSSPEEVQYITDHSEAPLIVVENENQLAKVKAQRDRLPHLRYMVAMDGVSATDDPDVMTWDQFIGHSESVPESALEERLAGLQPDGLATLIYTSGTTGPPKGVMLTHHNLAWTSHAILESLDFSSEDCSLSYLPLSHIAEQIVTIHGPITAGSRVYFAESIELLADNLREVRPTVFFGVPRVWEKIHAGITQRLSDVTGAKASLLRWASDVGKQAAQLRNRGGEPRGALALQEKLAERVVYAKIKQAVGLDRVRLASTAAAPIDPDILEFFGGIGLLIHEVYGLSENTGPATRNMEGATKFGSVGRPIPGTDVKIADSGEILMLGPHIFAGYYKDPAATDEALIDGWLHTGDLGVLDDDGYLHVTGRQKEIIITAGGKNIAPVNLEGAIKQNPLVSEAMVIGDRRKYLTAVVTISPDAAPIIDEPAHLSEQVQASIQETVDELNSRVAPPEQIKKFAVLPREFTIDDGELTGTLKLKRRIVSENFAATIEAMYKE